MARLAAFLLVLKPRGLWLLSGCDRHQGTDLGIKQVVTSTRLAVTVVTG